DHGVVGDVGAVGVGDGDAVVHAADHRIAGDGQVHVGQFAVRLVGDENALHLGAVAADDQVAGDRDVVGRGLGVGRPELDGVGVVAGLAIEVGEGVVGDHHVGRAAAVDAVGADVLEGVVGEVEVAA